MTGALRFEWTKLWSVRSTWWCLGAAAALMALFAPAIGLSLVNWYRDQGLADTVAFAEPALFGLSIAQFAVTAMAVLAVTSEYASGSIRPTLAAVPGRGRLLLAKTAVVVPVAAVTGALVAALGSGLAWPLLEGYGRFSAGAALLDVLQLGLCFGAFAGIAVGLAFWLRSTAGGLTAAFVLLAGVPAMLAVVHTPLLDTAGDYVPSTAATHLVQHTADSPYPAAVALLLLLAWPAAALALGLLTLSRRDA